MKHLTSAAVAGGLCLVGGVAGLSHVWTALAVFGGMYFYCSVCCKNGTCSK